MLSVYFSKLSVITSPVLQCFPELESVYINALGLAFRAIPWSTKQPSDGTIARCDWRPGIGAMCCRGRMLPHTTLMVALGNGVKNVKAWRRTDEHRYEPPKFEPADDGIRDQAG
jgi:hypothetical protein